MFDKLNIFKVWISIVFTVKKCVKVWVVLLVLKFQEAIVITNYALYKRPYFTTE